MRGGRTIARRATATAGAVALLLAIVPLQPAAALSSGCDILNGVFFNSAYGTATSGGPWDFEAGDTVTISVTPTAGNDFTGFQFRAPATTVLASGPLPGSVTYVFPSDVTVTDIEIRSVNGTSPGGNYTVSCTARAPLGAAARPAWLQATARASEQERCPDEWAPSWHEWPNGGRGGWVCVRTIPALGS